MFVKAVVSNIIQFEYTRIVCGKSYYKNGQLKKEENYIDGKQDGLWKWYHENGKLSDEVNYKHGEFQAILAKIKFEPLINRNHSNTIPTGPYFFFVRVYLAIPFTYTWGGEKADE